LPQPTDEHGMSAIVLRPIANPLTLTFLALAVGTFVVSGLELSWVSTAEAPHVGLAVMVFVFPLQALGSVFGFLARDSAAGTGSALLSVTWLSIGVEVFTSPPGRTSGALGLLLLGSATTIFVPAAASASGKPLVSVVLLAASVRFFLTAAYQLSASSTWEHAAAGEGLLAAVLGLYAGLALELEDQMLHTVLPTFRRGKGRKAITGTLGDELAAVHREAGVRRQL
jgi:uncharacterized protein